jgi:hypothetical protein
MTPTWISFGMSELIFHYKPKEKTMKLFISIFMDRTELEDVDVSFHNHDSLKSAVENYYMDSEKDKWEFQSDWDYHVGFYAVHKSDHERFTLNHEDDTTIVIYQISDLG